KFFRILVSEAAFLIWKLRCERRIVRENKPELRYRRGVAGRWRGAMDKRLQHDRLMTGKVRFRPRVMKERIVLDTWNGLVFQQDGEKLPDNWIRTAGGLV
ncbi:hypothetical protein EDD18DRAFT_1034271, partial [Armillaria luteobubalina]